MRKSLIFLSVVLLSNITAIAQDFIYNGIPYTVYDKMAKTCMVRPVNRGETGNTFSGNVVLPSKVYDGDTEYTLVKIGVSAFSGCTELTDIEIPSTVTYIDGKAFLNCKALSRIDIPEGVVSIQAHTFQGCSGLTEIRLPSKLKAIRNSSFNGCTSLLKIELPETLEIIEANAFSNCSSLAEVNIPHLISTIPSKCFSGTGLTSLVIPDNITRICINAYSNISKLESVEIPKNVTHIGRGAFSGCQNLRSITSKAVNAPILNTNTFSYANNSECTLTIPTGSEQSYIFGGWISRNLNGFANAINSDGDRVEPKYLHDGNWYVVDEQSKTAYLAPPPAGYQLEDKEYLNVPDSINGYNVTGIAPYAFSGATNLKSVNLTASIKEIGSAAFARASALENVLIPPSVTKMGDGVFESARNLTYVTLPPSITEIGDYMFSNSGISTLEIPAGVKRIGDSAFEFCKLQSLSLPEGLESIDEWAFYFSELISLEIPHSVTYIGRAAFEDMKNLKSINLPMGITDVNFEILAMDTNIKDTIVIPSSVEYIGRNAMLQVCPEKMYLGPNIKEIGESAIDATNIYISAPEPPVTNGFIQLVPTYLSEQEIKVYVQGEEAKKRYESVYPWYTYTIININFVEAESITLSPKEWIGKVGNTITLTATILPEDATNKSVEWASSDTTVATVDNNGLVELVNAGNCTITVSTTDGSNLKAECIITSESGIDDIFADDNATYDVYNLKGILLHKACDKATLKQLVPGVYVIRTGSESKTILIR